MKRGADQKKYFVIVDSYRGKARVYTTIESWVNDYMKSFNDKHSNSTAFLDLIKDIENKDGPEWAKSFVEERCRKFSFDGKEELLRAFKNLPYRADAIDIEDFLSMYEPDSQYFDATLIK